MKKLFQWQTELREGTATPYGDSMISDGVCRSLSFSFLVAAIEERDGCLLSVLPAFNLHDDRTCACSLYGTKNKTCRIV